MAGGLAWSYSDRALLRVLWADGLTGTQIALRLDRTKNSVIGMAHRLKLTARPSPLPGGITRNHHKIRAPAITLAPLDSLAATGTIHIPTHSLAPRTAPSKRPATTKPEPVMVRRPQRMCEWLSGDDKRTWVRCSEPAEFGKPYCVRHRNMAYIKRSPLKQEMAG